jgi:cell division transport system permease protein
MKFQQALYLTAESLRTLFRHKGIMSLSVVIMSLSLLLLAVFLLITDNVLSVLGKTQDELKVYVYLEDTVEMDQIERYHRDLLAMESVASIVFISKAAAMEEFEKELGEDQFILESLEANPLPASFAITLKEGYKDQDHAQAFAERAAALEGIEEVNYGKDFLERFSLIARVFLYVDAVLGFIVILSSVFIISNTVRLTILSRQKSIEILKLVGATNRFITTPFIIEGACQGGLASLISLGLLSVIYLVASRALPDVAFLNGEKVFLYILTCILLGSLGSYAALRRFLRL